MMGGGLLRTPLDGTGYPQVNLHGAGKYWHTTVHVLVLTAFDCPCPPGMECRHLNDIKTDNRWPENLCWGYPNQNQGEDRLRNGRSNRGERHGMHKLTEEQVREVLRRTEDPVYLLAQQFEVSRQCINHIRSRRRWAWVTL